MEKRTDAAVDNKVVMPSAGDVLLSSFVLLISFGSW
jgi:hypothetical protein